MGETKIDRRRLHPLGHTGVLRAAGRVGFAKMTVADICRRRDQPGGTFYLHCEDKYALLDALIDEGIGSGSPLEGG